MSTDLIDTPDRLKFDEAALARYLCERLPEVEGPVSIRKFAGGESNPTYLVVAGERSFVLRRKPPGKLLPSAHAVDREYRVMTALNAAGYPAPKTYLLCEDESIIGTMFYLMDFVDGRIFWSPEIKDVEATERTALFNAALDNLAALHRMDPDTVGLGDYGRRDGYFARQIDRWTKQYKAAETDPIPEIDRLIDWLPENVPEEDQCTIVHGDYKINNLIYAPDRPEVIATLDWELSTLGHPLADLSYFLMPWTLPSMSTMGFSDLDQSALGIPSMEDMITRYCAATGQRGLPDMNFCLAYNLFRFAGIVQGVYARALQGNASSADAGKYGLFVPFLGKTGWDFAQKAGA